MTGFTRQGLSTLRHVGCQQQNLPLPRPRNIPKVRLCFHKECCFHIDRPKQRYPPIRPSGTLSASLSVPSPPRVCPCQCQLMCPWAASVPVSLSAAVSPGACGSASESLSVSGAGVRVCAGTRVCAPRRVGAGACAGVWACPRPTSAPEPRQTSGCNTLQEPPTERSLNTSSGQLTEENMQTLAESDVHAQNSVPR
jgi:hypothetical protein